MAWVRQYTYMYALIILYISMGYAHNMDYVTTHTIAVYVTSVDLAQIR